MDDEDIEEELIDSSES